MAHIQAGSPSEVLILDDVTTNLELPSFTLHLANVLPLFAIWIRWLWNIHLVDHAIDLTTIVIELTIHTVAKE